MNISLNPHCEELVKAKVEELRREIQLGISSGESTMIDIEEIKQQGRKRLDEKRYKLIPFH